LAARGGGVQFELQGADTRFALGDPGTVQNAPVEVTQPWGDAMDQRPMDNKGGGITPAPSGQAPQSTIRVPTLPYLGMSTAIQKWGIGDTVSQGRELAWQRGVEGDKTKITQFQEMVGALQEFKTYLFMKKGSGFCTIIHSPTKFMALNKATQHLQGRYIRFIGDRMLTRNPTPILLPTQKIWQWVKEMVAMDGPAMIAFYEEDVAWQGTLWTPAAGCKQAEGHVQ
jgi:hypothetical protein